MEKTLENKKMTPFIWRFDDAVSEKVKINALICTYNCIDTIKYTLDSLLGRVDNIIILDNKWVGVKATSINSDDGTISFIVKWGREHRTQPLKLIVHYEYPLHQYEARNLLLNYVPDYECFWLLIQTK